MHFMLITRVTADVLRIPLPRSAIAARVPTSRPANRRRTIRSPSCSFTSTPTPALTGLGFAIRPSPPDGMLVAIVDDDLAPRLIGADPRVTNNSTVDSAATVTSPAALAAVDLAVWDLKAKAANLPLWQLLGGARDSAPAYAADTAGRLDEQRPGH